MRLLFIYFIFTLSHWGYSISEDEIFKFPIKYRFPLGSGLGIFLAVALPLNLPNKSVYMSYNFEANYALPDNSSYLVYPPVIEQNARTNVQQTDTIGRKLLYQLLESKLETNGFSGRMCILRAICEAASITLQNNGLVGDLLHIILTPSTTVNDGNLLSDYRLAEEYGTFDNCGQYKRNCSNNVLDLISWFGYGF